MMIDGSSPAMPNKAVLRAAMVGSDDSSGEYGHEGS
jgi:hypothetical protein